jgi:hypothetical protein
LKEAELLLKFFELAITKARNAKWTKFKATFIKTLHKNLAANLGRFFELNLSVLAEFCTVSLRS